MNLFRARKGAPSEVSSGIPTKSRSLLELPMELRLDIFDFVLQGTFVHVTPRPGPYAYARWTYLRCTRQTSKLDGHWIPCRPYAQSPVGWYEQWSSFLALEPAVISVLLSCRTLYADFVRLLYSRTLFDFHTLEEYLDFARYAPSTARQLKHIRTRHIDIDCPFIARADGHMQTQKDRTFVEALQWLFLRTPRLESLRLMIESTALWERKPQHQTAACWARIIAGLATLKRDMACYSTPPHANGTPSEERSSCLVRFDVAVLPETIVQTAPWPSYARLPNFVRPPRVEDSPELDRTLAWLFSEVMGNLHKLSSKTVA